MVLDPLHEEGFLADSFLSLDDEWKVWVFVIIVLLVEPLFDLNEIFLQSEGLLMLVELDQDITRPKSSQFKHSISKSDV